MEINNQLKQYVPRNRIIQKMGAKTRRRSRFIPEQASQAGICSADITVCPDFLTFLHTVYELNRG